MILVVGDQRIQPFWWDITRSNGWKLEADKFIIEKKVKKSLPAFPSRETTVLQIHYCLGSWRREALKATGLLCYLAGHLILQLFFKLMIGVRVHVLGGQLIPPGIFGKEIFTLPFPSVKTEKERGCGWYLAGYRAWGTQQPAVLLGWHTSCLGGVVFLYWYLPHWPRLNPWTFPQDCFSCGVCAEGTVVGWHGWQLPMHGQVAVPASLQPTPCTSCHRQTFLPIISSPFWFPLEYWPCWNCSPYCEINEWKATTHETRRDRVCPIFIHCALEIVHLGCGQVKHIMSAICWQMWIGYWG